MRKGKWKSRKGMALLALTLAFVLGLSGTGLLDTHAAGPVETNRTNCSLTVDVSSLYALVEEEYTDVRDNWPEDIDQDDLNALTASQVTVHLYKVADIDASGRYTAFGFFKSLAPELDFSDEVINSETSASTWNEMALQAAEAVRNAKDKEDWDILPADAKVEYSAKTENGKAEFDDLGVGLYLVVADKVETANYEYTFAPYLVSLPDNRYSREESVENDDWQYDVTMGLKVEQTPRYGTLEIVKARTSINGMPVTASTCVLEINIETPKGETEQRIAAADFTGTAGAGSTQVGKIPAGSKVTVKEIYAGAGYKQESGPVPAEVIIIAVGEKSELVKVNFTNATDNTTTGGYGIINTFEVENTAEEGQEEDWKYVYTGDNVPGDKGGSGSAAGAGGSGEEVR